MTPMEVAQVLAPAEAESDQTRLIEWLDLPYQKTLVHDFDWIEALRALHQLQGCDIISGGQTLDQEQPARLWIVVGEYCFIPSTLEGRGKGSSC